MRTIALVSQKGGVGKTTLAIHLATAFYQAGKATLVLDLDPQASAAEWHDARQTDHPHVESIQPARLAKTIKAAKDIGTEALILDTAPHAEASALEAARAADLVLVPCGVSIMDLRAMRATVDLLRLIKAQAFAVLNGVPATGTDADEAEETITKAFRMKVCPVRMGDRIDYSRCLITGQAAQEFQARGKAAREIEQFYLWTCKQLGI